MFKGHPKGLYVAFLTNMGERFGFYTMMAILVMFLQAKYGLTTKGAGWIYSVFYFFIYALALLGGFIADRKQNYKGVVATGLVFMFAGYILLAIPGIEEMVGLVISCIALGTIAFGNGLFKGNLQAIVGQMYDNPQYSGLRDSAYSIFYMGINIGAMFAPNAALGIQKWWLGTKGFIFHPGLPALCHAYNKPGTDVDAARLTELAESVTKSGVVTDLSAFTSEYLQVFSSGYNYAFGLAGIAMLISLVSFIFFKRHLPDRGKGAAGAAEIPQMPKEEEKQRLIALGLVFLVVIFFWMAFHQNGLTMTWFARDFTARTVEPATRMIFNIWSLLSIGLGIVGLVLALKPSSTGKTRGIGAAMAVAFAVVAYLAYRKFQGDGTHSIQPAVFQQFNAFFVVFLTPVVVGLFAWLRARGKEPSAPRKIGIGMIIAAMGFVILLAGSLKFSGVYGPGELGDAGLSGTIMIDGKPVILDSLRVSTQWLVQTYLVLTIAELFLSPMGLSFVSRVAPPRFQGLMQGGWLGATAIGNQLILVGALVWEKIPVWATWLIFIVCCLISAVVMFSLLKRLEKVAK